MLFEKKRRNNFVEQGIIKSDSCRFLFASNPLSYFLFQPVLHDWCNKGHGVLSCLWDGAYKRTLAVNQKVAHVAAAGFLSRYLNGPLPYV